MIRSNKLWHYLIPLLLFVSCYSQNKKIDRNGLGSVDLSPDDKTIIFSFSGEKSSSIYISKITGDSVIQVLSSTEMIYEHPKYSPNGNSILFLSFTKDKMTSNIFIADVSGKNRKQVTYQNQIITEATFSFDGDKIFYCKANAYEKYSPIGKKAPHGFDIYSVDIKTSKETKITNLATYRMAHLTQVLEKYLLLELINGDVAGINLISLSNPNEVRLLIPKNNPRGNSNMYGSPSYSKMFNLMTFTAPYELYIMRLDSLNAKLIYRPRDTEMGLISNVRFFHNQMRILFKKRGGNESFMIVNVDGSNLKRINLSIPD